MFIFLFIVFAASLARASCTPGVTRTEVVVKSWPTLEPSQPAGTSFGSDVAVPSRTDSLVAIGDMFAAARQGGVYLLRRDVDSNAWEEQSTLVVSPNAVAYERFGTCVAFDATGEHLLVTAWGAEYMRGTAYVFRYDAQAKLYVARAQLSPQPSYYNLLFGMLECSMSSDALHVAVSAEREDGNASSTAAKPNRSERTAGAVYLFSRATVDDDAWPERAYLKATDATSYDYFGQGVAFSDDCSTLAVGAPGRNRVYFYTREAVGWKTSVEQSVVSVGVSSNAQAGYDVVLNGDGTRALVGAPFHHVNGDAPAVTRGAVAAVFRTSPDATLWTTRALVLGPDNGFATTSFGARIAAPSSLSHVYVSGARASVGAMRYAGTVYEFNDVNGDDTSWTLQHTYTSSVPNTWAMFGMHVAVSESRNTFAAAAIYEGSQWPGAYAGATRVTRVSHTITSAHTGGVFLYDLQCPVDPKAFVPVCTYTLEAATTAPNLYTNAWGNFIVEFVVDGDIRAQYSLRTALAETVQRVTPAGIVQLRVADTEAWQAARASLRVTDDTAGGTEVYAAAAGELANVDAGAVLAEFTCQ